VKANLGGFQIVSGRPRYLIGMLSRLHLRIDVTICIDSSYIEMGRKPDLDKFTSNPKALSNNCKTFMIIFRCVR
jgi:hypothetical protein